MTRAFIGLGLLLVMTTALLVHWRISTTSHQRRLDRLEIRVHVNGIRGKSTVTRLVAGVLREGGYVTLAKTTGSAARVIERRGEEIPIVRRGAPTIHEQIDVVNAHVDRDVEALVIECMAVRPIYQQYSQDYLVRSDITIITNVREDHQEEMGETLEEIADSMAVTVPVNGVLITSEERPHLRERLRTRAEEKGSRLIYADPESVSDEELRGFDYLQFKDNVAIGLTVARLLGIRREAALKGMWKAVPDVGVIRLRTYEIQGKHILWVPMFAANDRESVIDILQRLQVQFPPGASVIGILNNRADRGRRAELFARMIPTDLASCFDQVILFGAYEEPVSRAIVGLGYPPERVHLLGDKAQPTLEQILDRIVNMVDGQHGVLVGMVNIHTTQAELLIEHFERLDGMSHRRQLEESREPARMPQGSHRFRQALTHVKPERPPDA